TDVASPATGKVKEFNREQEIVLEFLVDNKSIGNVLHTARSLHPYEKPMIITHNVKYPVKETYTLGKIGYFSEGNDFKSVLEHVKKCFKQESIRYHKNNDRPVKKVGIVGGSGISMMTRAASSGCDLFITGDLKHHDWDLAKELGLSIIEVSHFVMEELAFKIFFDEYKNILLKYNINAEYSVNCQENFNYF
ncbi:Nif3-like dinuclear metal center hexameric protein, partial [bacterium]|nr:Nif3-like dinuclear metal center hexameric protein [bacterium]